MTGRNLTTTARQPGATAARVRRTRARRLSGRRVYRVEVDEVAVEIVLTDLGYLNPASEVETKTIERGLSALIERICLKHGESL